MRLGGEHVIQLVLIHHRVRARIRASSGEEVENVPQARDATVEQVFALARAVEPTAHRDLTPRHRQRSLVRERQLDFGEAHRLARRGAVKDQVFHATAAQRFRALLAERPTHRLRDIALAAAVGADDSRDAGQDFHDDLFAE